jgi:hypothetical protein
MISHPISVFALLATLVVSMSAARGEAAVRREAGGNQVVPSSLDLAGSWRFQLDAEDAGLAGKWFARELNDRVQLPGTTDTNQKGIKTDYRPTDRLARVWSWIGPAWYQREVTIPESWQGKRVTLFFERSKNSRVWVNDTFIGRENSLSAPHVFDVSQVIKPGTHTITVLIDNAKLPPVGPSHAVDERTQTNWNGIVGTMELRASDPVWIDDVQVYPILANKTARVRVSVGNITGSPAQGKLTVSSKSYNVAAPAAFQTQTVEVDAPERENVIEFTYTPGGEVPLWSEFQPALMKLNVKLDASTGGERSLSDERSVRFGMREFTRDGNRLLINGKPVYLRGRLDCANYPLTGYAPMTVDEWRKIFTITNDWGINHYRFHSWCPPAAAFEAADELGVYLQTELPNKRSAFNAPDDENAAIHNIDFLKLETTEPEVSLYDYGKREGELIFRHYGNSPSLVMFTLGNELGRNQGMFDLVAHFKQIEPRALHAQGANNMHWNASLAEGDDFWVTAKVGPDMLIRGSSALVDSGSSHIEYSPPSTMVDYLKLIEGIPVPVISHEIGEFQVSPDFTEIPKFTGVLEARNYEIFRDRLEKAGMLDQAHDFVRASGALSAICYREDIEAALRTSELGGFQLLDIMDFPGQGTALVGMLNVFMESKGIIEPEIWREFCSETVPLFRMEKYTWSSKETLVGEVQVFHFGPDDLTDSVLVATVSDSEGKQLASHSFQAKTLQSGGLRTIGTYQLALESTGIEAPQKLTLTFAIEGTPYRNRYPIWVYPPEVDTTAPEGVMVTSSLHASETRDHLAAGGKVLLFPALDKLPHSVQGSFQTDFWSPMFAESAKKRGQPLPPGTLGILCDPAHPALKHFPTEYHSNWQWWHLVKNSRPIAYDGSPDDFRPAVQVIDNFARNHKLGLIAETRVGKGSVLICSINLPELQDKLEARQLYQSLLRYLASPDFAPKHSLSPELLQELLPE